MRSITLLAALVAAPLLIAAEPAQLQFDVTVLSGPQTMLDRAELKSLMPKDDKGNLRFEGLLDAADVARLIQTAREKCGAKVLVQPRLLSICGQRASFMSGGETPVHTGESVAYRWFGTKIDVTPTVKEGTKFEVDCTVDIRRGQSEHTVGTTRTMNLGQSVVLCAQYLPAMTDETTNTPSKISHIRRVSGAVGEHQAMIVCITPSTYKATPEPSANPDQAKNVAAMLAREYQQACNANNAELAAKLARMAVELDPLCFRTEPKSTPTVTPATAEAKPERDSFWRRLSTHWRVVTMLPSPYYLDHRPQYFVPDPECPLEKELATPQGYDRLPTNTEKSSPKKNESQPLPSVDIRESFWRRIWSFKSAYGSDPNTRMQHLVDQSEDLRQIRSEWQRIWFTDQPSNITPVRPNSGK